jgi:membrane-associated phospholipid phosphatase
MSIITALAVSTPWLHAPVHDYATYGPVLAWAAVLAALAIAFAWVYIGAHYPHDVATGLQLGAVITLVGWWPLRGALTRVVAWLAGTRSGRTGAPAGSASGTG